MANLPMKMPTPPPAADEVEDFGSQIRITPSAWQWPDATPGSRLIAFVIDSIIITAVVGLLGVFADRLFEFSKFPMLVKPFLVLAYYCYFQSRNGQTPGKKLVGIRVVTLEQNDGNLQIPIGRVIRRETIGRALNILSLGLGYFFVVFKEDHMGFHDKLARTRVVRLSESTGSQIQLKYVFAGVAVVIAAVIGYGYHTYFYTALPLKKVATELEKSGFTFEKLGGSLTHGFTIGAMTFENDDMRVELNGLSFAADCEKSCGEVDKLKVGDVVVESGHVTMKRFLDSTRTASMTDRKEAEGPFGAESTRHRKLELRDMTVANVDLSQIEVSLPGRPIYHLKRVYLSGIEVTPSLHTTSLARIYIDSDALTGNFEDVLAQEKRLSFGKQATLQLLPALDPDVIVRPIDVQFEGFFENGKPTQLKLSAFSNMLQAKWYESSGEVVVHDLSPLNYFKTELPLWKMNFKVAMDEKHVKIEQLQGSVGIRNVQFNMDSLGFVTQRGARKFTLTPRLSADWKSMLAGRDPGFILGSSDHQSARDVLTDLYFARPYAVLSVDEKAMVEKDVRFFADTVDAGTPAPVPMKIVQVPQQAPPPRQPTSFTKPAVHARTLSAMPTKLPPYRVKRK